jgi:hypothetical protein
MARARNIKPSFFTNDDLAEVPALGRLLFIALWTMADREGRMEDRPKRIKAEALPYDDCDANELLDRLAERGFIARYTVGETRFIQVVNFAKHQTPHPREAPSQLPAKPRHDLGSAEAQPRRCPAHLNPDVLIPDSGDLIPDSLRSDSGSTFSASESERAPRTLSKSERKRNAVAALAANAVGRVPQ